MSHWEAAGKSNDWYTPKWIFDALGCEFATDVAAARVRELSHVPASWFIVDHGLTTPWRGFVWMNPPFGGRNALGAWLEKFIAHDNGLALTPDRTSAPWFRKWAPHALSILFLPKVRFLRPDGTEGKSPSNGTALWAAGEQAHAALIRASRHGVLMIPVETGEAMEKSHFSGGRERSDRVAEPKSDLKGVRIEIARA